MSSSAACYIPFGAFDNPAKLLPQVVAGLRSGTGTDLSPCTQRRDFIGVGDVCRGYLALIDDLERGGFDIFNLSSGVATPLRQLLIDIASILDADPVLLRFGARDMRPGEGPISFGANTKAMELLGWAPQSLAQSLGEELL